MYTKAYCKWNIWFVVEVSISVIVYPALVLIVTISSLRDGSEALKWESVRRMQALTVNASELLGIGE
jgi:hypothetical protein